MTRNILTLDTIKEISKLIAEKYNVQAIYLFGSYAREEATKRSDLDFLVYGGNKFKRTLIFSLAEDLRNALKRDVDAYEIHELNIDSEFYRQVMKEKKLVA